LQKKKLQKGDEPGYRVELIDVCKSFGGIKVFTESHPESKIR
jgi:hypothetical protein